MIGYVWYDIIALVIFIGVGGRPPGSGSLLFILLWIVLAIVSHHFLDHGLELDLVVTDTNYLDKHEWVYFR